MASRSASDLCDEIRVADDSADEEAVVSHFSTLLNTGSTQIQVHLVVGTGDGCQVKVSHSVELQLEGQRWLQITVNTILLELSRLQIESQSSSPLSPVDCGIQTHYQTAKDYQYYHYLLLRKYLTPSLALKVKNLGNSLC